MVPGFGCSSGGRFSLCRGPHRLLLRDSLLGPATRDSGVGESGEGSLGTKGDLKRLRHDPHLGLKGSQKEHHRPMYLMSSLSGLERSCELLAGHLERFRQAERFQLVSNPS